MRLSDLVNALPGETAARVHGKDDPVVGGLVYDSRKVVPGSVFVALRGADVDGHQYLGQALGLGATAIVVEELPANFDPAMSAALVVEDTRRALAPLACRFYGNPAREIRLIGVTGTNGKTSTSYLVESMLLASNRSTGLIGTVEMRFGAVRERTLNTTPESADLQRTLRAMRTGGVTDAVLEVSSHGVALGRIGGCVFAAAAFTNLSQDHLDFHMTMDAYRDAKLRFFADYLAPDGAAVVNLDDAAAEDFLGAARSQGGRRIVRVSRNPDSDAEVALLDADLSLDETRARLRIPGAEIEATLPLIGDFNLENLLVAVGLGVALELPRAGIADGIAACPQVPGRMERVESESDEPTVLVDYAHTPDAVDKLLRTVRPLADGRVVTVFGCGGDRDRSKRPLMAEAAVRSSDRVVATSDNPRSEEPLAILADVEQGLGQLSRVDPDDLPRSDGAYTVVPDRREAIDLAISAAQAGDIVVLAGKGHEDYQIVGRERLPFDDRLEARAALRRQREAR
jgi:UDP-N-acetylmuramoyl-L-alanyl-D-glutamate--2,6-diaminopimelate ligase